MYSSVHLVVGTCTDPRPRWTPLRAGSPPDYRDHLRVPRGRSGHCPGAAVRDHEDRRRSRGTDPTGLDGPGRAWTGRTVDRIGSRIGWVWARGWDVDRS